MINSSDKQKSLTSRDDSYCSSMQINKKDILEWNKRQNFKNLYKNEIRLNKTNNSPRKSFFFHDPCSNGRNYNQSSNYTKTSSFSKKSIQNTRDITTTNINNKTNNNNEINVFERRALRLITKEETIIPQLETQQNPYTIRTINYQTERNKSLQQEGKKRRNLKLLYLNKEKLTENLKFRLKEIKDDIFTITKQAKKIKTPNIPGILRTDKNNRMKSLMHSSLYIKEKPISSNLMKRLLQAEKRKSFVELSDAIKWEGIRQLWEKHGLILGDLIRKYKQLKWLLEKENLMTKNKFKEFIQFIQEQNQNIEHKNITEDIFDIFGYQRNEFQIEFKEIIHCLIVSYEKMTFEWKIKFLCDIWEIHDTKLINVKEMLRLIRINLFFKKDYEMIFGFFKEHEKKNAKLSKDTMYSYFTSNDVLIKVMKRNLDLDFDKIQKKFDNEIKNVLSANSRRYGQFAEIGAKNFDKAFEFKIENIVNILEKTKNKRKELEKFIEDEL